MPISVDLETNPIFRETLDRVRSKARRDVAIDSTFRLMRARCKDGVPEDLVARLETLSDADLDVAFMRSIKAVFIDDVLRRPFPIRRRSSLHLVGTCRHRT